MDSIAHQLQYPINFPGVYWELWFVLLFAGILHDLAHQQHAGALFPRNRAVKDQLILDSLKSRGSEWKLQLGDFRSVSGFLLGDF